MRMIVVATMLASSAAMAASPPGASSCSGCHAATGTSAIPAITGRPAEETLAAMVAFRDSTRPATLMTRIAKGFTDDELRAIAAWLAIQK